MNTLRFHRQALLISFSIVTLLLAGCGSLQGNPPQRMITIGIVNYVQALNGEIDGFKAGMADLGYVEGKTVTYLYDGLMKPDPETLDKEIQDLLKRNTDIFLALGTPPSERIKNAIQATTKSAVFAPVINPVDLGLVSSLQKPGGRITGIDSGGTNLEKGLEWLLRVAPATKRLHVPYRQADDNAKTQLPTLQAAAAKLKIELLPEPIDSFDQAMAALSSYDKGTDAVFVVPALSIDNKVMAGYIQKATELGIPVGSTYTPFSVPGALVTISNDPARIGKQAARMVHQLIQGADPGTIPVESAEITYGVNLLAANALGITVPDSVLQQANNIIREQGATATQAK